MEEIKEFIGLAGKYFMDAGVTDEKVECLVMSELSIFFKYLLLSSVTLEQTSQGWQDLVCYLQKLVKTVAFQKLII